MVDYFDYKELLKRARSQLPEVVFSDVRFEIPSADSFVEGNRTIIKNFKDIAKFMERDTHEFAKFVMKELGTAGDMEGNRLILQGKFGWRMVNEKIQNYVNEYVLCPECGKPDTKIIKEGRIHFLKCTACGAMKPLKSL
ncbi:putative translation initiation factor aIF-2, beta subunit [Methanococcus vannielii SB]|uniref:Translation initiation factor 2 subunit beta n=1 Tax=Methanococcus vannielii (strain ATCC 35089 / DSM 1224 / JCM 13029 / OCM 148 / SB) TaxID=406327 RepID=IF2B_METVS|nr:translation initiation factor IF-2 subunit beta [Methanococcus vannielii]A6URT3.1 RecName: Full=Translation initiation factor 2 subunit beta; AltName: Full=aIF2-beta; AltName: Full=eIF-2-beta [Methanococcus vannielii SB]ABR55205.1 putative translation initiation factor aIF-2, beta subunit [Methanococcus vannielii SB]